MNSFTLKSKYLQTALQAVVETVWKVEAGKRLLSSQTH